MSSRDLRGLVDLLERVDELEAGERHAEHAVDAVAPGPRRPAAAGTVSTIDRDPQAGLVDLGDEVHALDPALEQRSPRGRRPGGARR